MATEVVMPKLGLSMLEGVIVQWLKQEGESIEKDEPLLEVETEKMVSVVEAPASGIVARILHPADSTVPVSQVIAVIAEPGEPLPDIAPSSEPAQDTTTPPSPDVAPATQPRPPSPGGIVPAVPAARRLAGDRGLDLGGIPGTGPSGVITRADVERVTAPAPQAIEKVAFFSEGHRLDGLLYRPRDLKPGEERPAVILCAGFTYLKSLVMPDIARVLNAAGYVAFIFDYRGFGDSGGPRWRLIPGEQVNDIHAALTFVADQPHVDPKRLAVLGVSLGGSNAVVAGALDRRVGAVVAIESIGHGERWLRSLRRHWEWLEFEERLSQDRSQRVRTGESCRVDPLEIVVPDPESREFLEAVYQEYPQMRCDLPFETGEALMEFRPEAHVEFIAPRPVLFIHGEDDRQVSADESRCMFERAAGPSELHVVPGMGHFDWVMSGSPGFTRVTGLVLDFLRQHMPV